MSILRRVMMPHHIDTSHNNTSSGDFYDPDSRIQDSPILAVRHVNLKPSPPPIFPTSSSSPVTPTSTSSPEPGQPRKTSTRSHNLNSQGDAVLIHFLDGGRMPELARTAGSQPLGLAYDNDNDTDEPEKKGEEVDLRALAGEALHVVSNAPIESGIPITNGIDALVTKDASNRANGIMTGTDIAGEKVNHAHSNRAQSRDKILDRQILVVDVRGRKRSDPIQLPSPQHEELAPMQEQSPEAEKINGHVTLPSISAQLGDITQLADTANKIEGIGAHRPSFSGSPPRPPLFAMPAQTAGSPPVSPVLEFRRELPSPFNSIRRPSQVSETPYSASSAEYSGTTETPNTEQSGPSPQQAVDRMSIDGITNPQVGGFRCTYTGCTAPPFQTQYLLNSHANVHSQVRPHYCTVKGCSRSEGGKGFKRKNEMIRHGLVHASPGYVCPFCPDRDHKYPRPDNLQRHVRVHHVDKDKDDTKLREVLSQRPEGPNRGRRRRGGTS